MPMCLVERDCDYVVVVVAAAVAVAIVAAAIASVVVAAVAVAFDACWRCVSQSPHRTRNRSLPDLAACKCLDVWAMIPCAAF